MIKTSQERSTRYDLEATALLRGIAILAVITLHFLSGLPATTYIAIDSRLYTVALDQFCRFCVPLFVALSGYGFWQKYQKNKLNWKSFIMHQSMKLLPLYVAASTIFFLSFTFVSYWRPTWSTPPFFLQLLTGQADYHLYFVPMIFQFYLIFPLLFWCMKKAPNVTLLVSGVWQIVLYLLFSDLTPTPLITKYFLTDYLQYVWFFSWIFYFVLGMRLTEILNTMKKYKVLLLVTIALTAFGWWWTTAEGLFAMSQGVDPIIAMRFTRIPVLIYASSALISFMAISQILVRRVQPLVRPLVEVGKQSYLIYLFHTFFLRVLFTVIRVNAFLKY
jgi:probable poly-beta-1,6-N-acetyl-D-glucosamine export protein